MSIIIRKFRKEDAIKVSNVIKQAFRSLVPQWYSEESVEDQIKNNSPKKLIEKAKNVNYFVAVEKNRILGIGGYSSEKIHTFFVRPKIHGQGIGGKIMEKVLSEADKNGVRVLTCWATFNAVKFYSKFGFKKIKKIKVKSKKSSITFVGMIRIKL